MIWNAALNPPWLFLIQLVNVITSRHEEVLWRLFLAKYNVENVKIITWSICCCPQDLQWIKILNRGTSNDLHSTVLGEKFLLHKLHWALNFSRGVIWAHAIKQWAFHPLLIHCRGWSRVVEVISRHHSNVSKPLRIQGNCILRALNFKVSSGSMPPSPPS